MRVRHAFLSTTNFNEVSPDEPLSPNFSVKSMLSRFASYACSLFNVFI